jgi:hypothetical protein
MMRRMRELDREYGGRTPAPGKHPPRQRRRAARKPDAQPRRHADRRLGSAVLFLALLAAGTWMFASSVLGGFGVDEVKRALGFQPDPDEGIGSYEFMATQRDNPNLPVAYSPCKEIVIVVNDAQAPKGTDGLVEEAVDEVADLTGLKMRVAGTTGEEPVPNQTRGARQPVLVAWTDPDQVPELKGDVAGLGGSTQVSGGGSLRGYYVSGQVALDSDQLADILDRDGPAQVKAIILHELGHLVGLAHTSDRSQLMSKDGAGTLDFQSGDRTGLKILGQGTCSG